MTGSDAETNMAFDFTSIWKTAEASDEGSTEDGYPLLRDLDLRAHLTAQGLEIPPVVAVSGADATIENIHPDATLLRAMTPERGVQTVTTEFCDGRAFVNHVRVYTTIEGS